MKRPSIILTSKFSIPSQGKFSKYLGYMARKEALEKQDYLTDEQKKELKALNYEIRKVEIKTLQTKTYYSSNQDSEDPLQKDAEKILHAKSWSELADQDFEKYLGYMARIGALAKVEHRTSKEEQELQRVTKASQELGEFHPTKDKLLLGVYTSDMDQVHLGDLQHIRDKLNSAQKHGSVMWQDVVSFDNVFLVKHKILNQETGKLDETLLRKATASMMEVMENETDPPLYRPYWTASIHRNTDNVHIHIAIVEEENHRPIIERTNKFDEVVSQPRGKRTQKTIDHMKSKFANTLFDTSELTKQISIHRDAVRQGVKTSLQENLNDKQLQKQLNEIMAMLPSNRQSWNYAFLEKFDKKTKKKLDHFTNELLKNNQDWKEYQELVISYQKNREELYGKSKRDNKDYAQNKIEDMKRRNGNAVLHVLAGLDKNANKYRKKLFADAYLKDTVPTENYIQSVLRELDRQVKYKQTHPKVAYIKKIKSSKKKKLKSLNLSQPLYTHASIGKLRKRLALQSKRELALAKSFTSKTKKEALREYEKMQAKEARSSENLGF